MLTTSGRSHPVFLPKWQDLKTGRTFLCICGKNKNKLHVKETKKRFMPLLHRRGGTTIIFYLFV